MNACAHPAEQQQRTIYYLICGACKQVRLVYFCNYSADCHPQCTLAAVCIQPARVKYHAAVALAVEPGLQ